MSYKKKTKHISSKDIKNKSKKSIYKKFNDDHFKVTVFGSARIKPDDQIYKDIREMAGMVATK